MEYICFGSGPRTMVILPGISLRSPLQSAATLPKRYEKYTDDYTIYLFDRKKDMQDGYTVYDMSNDTAEAMRVLGIEDAYVFGYSQGGMMAMIMAINHPELIKCLVLGSTTSRQNEVTYNVMRDWVILTMKNEIAELNRNSFRLLYSERFVRRYERVLSLLSEGITKEDCEKFIALCKAGQEYDIYDSLSEIHCPAFVIGANDDKVVTGQASIDIAEKLGCEYYMYDNYGHAVYDEAPDYTGRIFDFFNNV